ncbi:hypothetical protein [Caudoviricetes sp.]|nr:hypothetical protein [Caudoviricetes sp.]
MQIPTIESNGSLLGRGAQLPMADADAFGSARGSQLQRLGANLMQTAETVSAVEQTHKRIESEKWVNDAMSQLHEYYSGWMANGENNSKESFADDFKKLSDQSLTEWENKAPSREAAASFRAKFQSFSNSRYEAAAVTSARTQLNNMVNSHVDMNDAIIKSYQTDRSIPNLDANTELVGNMERRFSEIDSTFGQVAPTKGRQLKAQVAEDAAYAVMNYSPETARSILKKATGILEQRQIHTIENQIKVAEEASKIVDRTVLDNLIANRKALAENFKKPDYLTLDDVKPYLPDAQAKALVAKVNAEIEVYNTSADHIAQISALNPEAQIKYVEKLASAIGDEPTAAKNSAIASIVSKKVDDNLREIRKDPAGYMLRNNPGLKAINDHIQSLSKSDNSGSNADAIRQKMAERDAMMLQLQSRPPGGDTSDMHFLVNRSQLKVISDNEADAVIQKINQSSPQEVVNTIKQFLVNHPKNEKIAFNNLVQVRDGVGLRGDYWLLYKNIDNVAAADLAGALKSPTAGKDLAPEKLADYNKALDGNVRWKAFQQVFPNDNYQMLEMTDGMRRGVLAYAHVLSQSGLSAEKAIAKSVDTWVSSEMSVVPVNGQPVLFDKVIDGKKFSDQEVENLANRLAQLPKELSPKSIKLTDEFGRSHFPTLDQIGNEMTKMEVLRQLVIDRGFFKPAGDYATLYMRNDTGTPFEVRDHNNQAIAIKLSDVPTYAGSFTDSETGLTFPVPNNPVVRPLVEKRKVVKEEPFAPDLPEYRSYKGYTKVTTSEIISTNWPVEPTYVKRMQR